MFIVRRLGSRRTYLAPPGSLKSYTSSLAKARKFSTWEETERERCENEHVERVS